MILVSSAAFFWRFQLLETTPTNTCIIKPDGFIQGIKKSENHMILLCISPRCQFQATGNATKMQ